MARPRKIKAQLHGETIAIAYGHLGVELPLTELESLCAQLREIKKERDRRLELAFLAKNLTLDL